MAKTDGRMCAASAIIAGCFASCDAQHDWEKDGTTDDDNVVVVVANNNNNNF